MPIFDAASTQGTPSPFWLVEFFKTLGFALHLIPMGLWLVGIPISIILWLLGGATSKRLAQRFFQQVPIIVAIGICLGVLPLLFIELAYPKVFFTSTILLGAHWAAIVPLLAVAYYTSCLTAAGARAEKFWRTSLYACVASCCYVVVGLIFSSVWTFAERPYDWENVWQGSRITLGKLVLGGDGLASGLGIYWSDLTIFLRFAGIVGIGFFALATWFVLDAYYLYRGPRKLTSEEQARLRGAENSEEPEEGKKKRPPRRPIQENGEIYPHWTTSVAFFLLLPGLLIAAAAVGKYAFESAALLQHDEDWNPVLWNVLLGGFAASMILPFLFILLNKLKKLSGRALAIMMILCELALVGFFSAMRQILQNARLRPYFDASKACDPAAVQWIPIVVFLLVLLTVAVAVFFVVSTLAPHDKKRAARKPKKVKEPKNKKKASDKTETKEPPKASSNDVPRQNESPNVQQIRGINGRGNLRR